ncbi:MAG: HD domain-containing protein [Planctomycetaceae bacterium]|jgi:3'-5' exoribonuclease|nr:HD domain-containing protein [Planctomycetaceae bacterium]
MAHQYINQLRDTGQVDSIYVISDKQLRPNKNGNLYLQYIVRDKTGSMSGRLWNITDTAQCNVENGDYVRVVGAVQNFQGALQLITKKIIKVDPATVNEEDYVTASHINIPHLRSRLKELTRTINDHELLSLADCIILDEELMKQFCMTPAGVKLHHAYEGGLLEHTVTMMEVADRVASLYPILNRDMLLVGVFLHDIGKIREMTSGNEMVYTSQGQILGHPFLGVEILYEYIQKVEQLLGEPFDAEKAMLLKHLLISHHGSYENNAARLPMTLEAIALHYIDSLDSKIAEFSKYIADDPNVGASWTNYIPGIDRKLYKFTMNRDKKEEEKKG